MIRFSRVVALACVSALPLVVLACKKDPPAVVEEAAAPPPVEIDAGVVELVPLIEDAGPDVTDADAAKKATGTGVTANQSRAKQCCNALRSQAKALGASPEAAQLQSIAATCDVFAAQLGPTAGGQSPELAPLRTMLKGKTLPAVCQGL